MGQRRTVTDDSQQQAMATRLSRLGDKERRSRDEHEADREARDAAIYEADAGGWGTRAIARGVGLDPSTVQSVIIRETARRQRAGGK